MTDAVVLVPLALLAVVWSAFCIRQYDQVLRRQKGQQDVADVQQARADIQQARADTQQLRAATILDREEAIVARAEALLRRLEERDADRGNA